MQQELFIRAEWDDVLISNLNISGFVVISPYDGSLFGQLSGSYFLSRNWTFAGYLGAALGSAESEYGSLPESTGTAFRLIRYF